jgi:hypothetical protein
MSLAVDGAVILRGSDSITQGGWDGCSTTAEIMLNACDSDTTYTPQEIIHLLRTQDSTNLKIRAEVGRELGTYAGVGWVGATPRTEYGEMLISKIDVVEDSEAQGGWKIIVTSEGMGRLLVYPEHAGVETTAGVPLIRMNITHRARTTRAWRVEGAADNTVPQLDFVTDVIDHGDFKRDPWYTGDDIDGLKVDINRMPVPYRIPQKVIQIDVVRRGDYHGWANDGTAQQNPTYINNTEPTTATANKLIFPSSKLDTLPPFAAADGKYSTGGRNTVAFLGFGIGELLLASVTVSTIKEIGNFKMISYVLIGEPNWKHADQMILQISGVSDAGNTTQDGTTGQSQALFVMWNQTALMGWETVESDWPNAEWDYLQAMST